MTQNDSARQWLGVFRYSILVWLTGLLAAPTLLVLGCVIGVAKNGRDFVSGLKYFGSMWPALYSLEVMVASILCWLLFFWITHWVCVRTIEKWEKKWLLFVFGSTILLLLLLCLSIAFTPDAFSIVSIVLYWVPVSVAIIFYRLPNIKADPA